MCQDISSAVWQREGPHRRRSPDVGDVGDVRRRLRFSAGGLQECRERSRSCGPGSRATQRVVVLGDSRGGERGRATETRPQEASGWQIGHSASQGPSISPAEGRRRRKIPCPASHLRRPLWSLIGSCPASRRLPQAPDATLSYPQRTGSPGMRALIGLWVSGRGARGGNGSFRHPGQFADFVEWAEIGRSKCLYVVLGTACRICDLVSSQETDDSLRPSKWRYHRSEPAADADTTTGFSRVSNCTDCPHEQPGPPCVVLASRGILECDPKIKRRVGAGRGGYGRLRTDIHSCKIRAKAFSANQLTRHGHPGLPYHVLGSSGSKRQCHTFSHFVFTSALACSPDTMLPSPLF